MSLTSILRKGQVVSDQEFLEGEHERGELRIGAARLAARVNGIAFDLRTLKLSEEKRREKVSTIRLAEGCLQEFFGSRRAVRRLRRVVHNSKR